MIRQLSLVLLGVSLVGCARADEPDCLGKHMDFAWTPLSERNLIGNLSDLISARHGKQSALELMGAPRREGEATLTWVYGMRQEGRDCLPNGAYASTFIVEYAIVDVTFLDDVLQGCTVTERTMISGEADPDPFDGHAISTRSSECRAFLAGQQERDSVDRSR